jgi:hypothetical protein
MDVADHLARLTSGAVLVVFETASRINDARRRTTPSRRSYEPWSGSPPPERPWSS